MEDVRKLLKMKEEEVFRLRNLVAELEAKLPVPSEHKRERGFGISAEPQTLKTVKETNLEKYPKPEKLELKTCT